MSAFTALNVEPDEIPEDDIDKTREIQLEEALKLYQNALKLHAQGPKYYTQAAEAYDILFKSDVFKYPESLTDFTQDMPNVDLEPEFPLQDGFLPAYDDGPSTLPQILYLAYKNHGQFIMDCLKYRIRRGPALPRSDMATQAHLALEEFTQALARDESDTELWRRAARVGGLLGSNSIARYCLEAAVEVDDDPALGEVDPANLEEGFAGIQLKDLLEALSDKMALSHPIMAPYEKKQMPARLRKYLDPYPFLKSLPADHSAEVKVNTEKSRHMVKDIKLFTWDSVADAIYSLLDSYGEDYGSVLQAPAGAVITFNLPDLDVKMGDGDLLTRQSTDVSISTSENARPAVDGPPGVDDPPEIASQPEVAQDGNEGKGEDDSSQATRKRSQSAAGLPETPDEETGAQKRSKRIRNRDTLGGEGALPADPNAGLKLAYDTMCGGDQYMFSYIDGLLEKLDVRELGTSGEVQAILNSDAPQTNGNPRNVAMLDLRDLIHKWDTSLSTTFHLGNGLDIMGSSGGLKANGLRAFHEHSKNESLKTQTQADLITTAGVPSFVKSINEDSLTSQEAAYRYFKAMCPSYRNSLWPDNLKVANIKLMNLTDSVLYSQLDEEYQELRCEEVESANWQQLKEFAQMMLELHLDVYISITNPQSITDISSCNIGKERLDKWAALVSDIMQTHSDQPESQTAMRHLWASVLLASVTEDVSREHMILCWADMQSLLQKSQISKIELYNNVAMPEVSASAADREISRLTTMDFFLNLFKDDSDPAMIIETLEPVIDDSTNDDSNHKDSTHAGLIHEEVLSTATRDMRKFLENSSPSLRLYLWQRLREAYQEIEYPTKVFSCHLKCIEIIVGYLQSSKFSQMAEEARHKELLGYLKAIDELLVKALTLALNDQTAFDIIDDSHLASSTKALASLCRMLHAGTLLEDQVTAGLIPDNTLVLTKEKGKPSYTSLKTFLLRLSEMSIRSWALLYTLTKEGISQNKSLFPTVDNDLAEFLAVVHYSLGLRVRCERSNKIFLKMMKVELIRMKYFERWEDYLGQVLFDLYGIRFGEKNGVFKIMDHGCDREKLDRRTAISLVEHVILLANRMSMKDLLRDELRLTIESMQQVIGAAKTSAQTSHNLRNITEYLKLSIHPLRLNKALRGMEYIDTLPVRTAESSLAEKGWYFLLGMMSLSKFRSQKRVMSGATDDLKIAASFFRLQLQFTAEHWEAWYRLAQCFDSELEEDVMWSAEKLNCDRVSLVSEQRSAIHCYTMAVSTAMRTADASFETAEKMSAMFHDFGLRIYSSSRDPFHMEAFYMDDYERHMSGPGGMYKKSFHEELTRYKAWRLAAGLFRRAIAEKPNYWMSHYMLAKCYWKMFTRVEDEPDPRARAARPSLASLVLALEKAVETCPRPRDSRSEPILEPHYKIVSIIHKLVQFRMIDPQEAADILQRQHFAIKKGEPVVVNDDESWEAYMGECIRHLRNLDRSNWQHRIISRAAHLIYDNKEPEYDVVFAARAEMTSSIFTKTMVVNVWKPEFERPGRHFVYMTKYVKFMVHLLLQLKDKANMEALAKRVRKKQTEYYHFDEVWTECCLAYCKLIRKVGNIELNQDELIKSIPPEDLEDMIPALEAWADDPTTSHGSYDHLKEALELKKLNGNLMKAMPIDDLISDAYATLLWEVGRHLIASRKLLAEEAAARQPPIMKPVDVAARQGPMSMSSLVNGSSMPVEVLVDEVRDVVAKPKAKAPGRREILRRAEHLVTRAHEGKEKEKEKASGRTESRRPSDIQILVQRSTPTKNNGKDEGVTQGQAEDHDEGDGHGDAHSEGEAGGHGHAEENGHAADRESSPPGSVHDSADDESDLSDAADADVDDGIQSIFNRWGVGSHIGSGSTAEAREME